MNQYFPNYDSLANAYDTHYISNECKEERAAIRTLFLQIHDVGNKRIIDLGCGTGKLLDLVGEQISSSMYVGIDSSDEMIKLATRKHPSRFFIATDAGCLIKKIALKHDIVVSLFSIPYFGIDAVYDIYNLLNFDGFLFVVYYNRPYANTASVYAGREEVFNKWVYPRVQTFIGLAKELFTPVYIKPLTASGAYNVALFLKK